METGEAIKCCKQLLDELKLLSDGNSPKLFALKARVCDLIYKIGGKNNLFIEAIYDTENYAKSYHLAVITEVLSSFITHLEAGLVGAISPKYQAELNMVSELLEQSNNLLANSKVHPAAPAVLIGATLEEFLRTWVEEAGLSLGSKKATLDSYTKLLRENELITKQDAKDITAWAGIRNEAAHGNWSEVGDPSRIRVMLDGVNLFIRQKTG